MLKVLELRKSLICSNIELAMIAGLPKNLKMQDSCYPAFLLKKSKSLECG